MRKVFSTIGWFVALVCVFSIPILLLGGVLALFERFGEHLAHFCGWLLLATLLLLLFTPFRRLRGPIGLIINVFTYVWGTFVWLYSAYVCWALWGLFGLLVGIFVLGVGVAPVALLALLFHGHGADAGWLLLAIAFVFAFRMLSIWLMSKSAETARDQYIVASDSY